MSESAMEAQIRDKGMAAGSSVLAAIFLTSLKLVVGLMTGSLGILAEAAHSGLDLVAALITFFAVRVSDRPADKSHLYGHGKVENLSALVETLLLLITCVWIIYEAVNRLFFETKEVDPSIWAFLTMGTSIVVDYTRSRVLYRAAKKYKSQALEADALHFSTDIWSSSVVIVGLALVWVGEAIGQASIFVRADALAALVVAVIVVYVSTQLGKRTVDALLDHAPSGLADQIAAAALRVPGVHGIDRVRVRGSGNTDFVDLDIAVPRHLSFEESHAVTDSVEAAVREISPNADVVVHAYPIAGSEGIMEIIQALAARNHFSVHNITTHWTSKGIWVDLDLEVDPDLSLERAHELATRLETEIHTELARSESSARIADINIHIEPRAERLLKGSEIPPEEASQYINRIHAIQQDLPNTHSVQDIQLQNLDGTVYLSFHLMIDAGLALVHVHSLSEEMENRLRREFPELGRVVVHAEPYPIS